MTAGDENYDELDRYGASVAEDGNHLVIGADKDEGGESDSGAAYAE